MHSTWSDGKDSLEAMIAAAAARGYEYHAISDHSAGRGSTFGLDPEKLRAQRAAVRELAERSGIRTLCASEVDILPDGSMDFSDEVLAEPDFVIGSVHSAVRQTREEMTASLIRVCENPFVNVIGHPTGPANRRLVRGLRVRLRRGFWRRRPAPARRSRSTANPNGSTYRVRWRAGRGASASRSRSTPTLTRPNISRTLSSLSLKRAALGSKRSAFSMHATSRACSPSSPLSGHALPSYWRSGSSCEAGSCSKSDAWRVVGIVVKRRPLVLKWKMSLPGIVARESLAASVGISERGLV